MFCKNCRSFYSTISANSVKRLPKTLNSKWKYELDPTVEDRIQDEIIKPRHHPGISKSNSIFMPRSFIEAVRITLEDEAHPKANILQNSPKFIRYLKEKKPPMEQDELKEKVRTIKNEVLERLSQKRCDLLNDDYVIKSQMNGELKRRVYNWTPTKYDKLNALFYLVGKSAADYAVLLKIFSEIKARDINWNPRSLFDYGSGVGTVTWAANSIWPNSIFEFFNVDVSADMNELAEHLLKGGRGEKQISLKGVYYRQFLPATAYVF
ncbi:hypothetical protein WA026_013228 [Henosepilachna vigintioctopunctata]|uniref:Methyltransferase-like protein 17, mitochondrial n=1 Tax=Henosepilachna vigintioctopunctata TaxID=420089 RepID=A0AAW1UK41_9CUCU